MAWPKRGTRRVVVDGELFLWHGGASCLWCSSGVLTAGKPGAPFVLFVDAIVWGFEVRPACVAAAIRWALQAGWSAEEGPTRALALNENAGQFEWLPEGQRHLACATVPPRDP